MKNSLKAALLALVAVSCGKASTIDIVVKDAPESAIVVKKLDGTRSIALDTLKTDASGTCKFTLRNDEPEFLYLYYGERQIASLILRVKDKIGVVTDTLGAYSTVGSEESLKLQKVENAYNAFQRDMNRILATDPAPDAALSRCYVSYYRDRVSYVMQNSRSLSVVPVFFQNVNANMPVFGEPTDGLLMNAVADSLSLQYPGSRYVHIVKQEARRRLSIMDLRNKIQNAGEAGYLDIVLPGMEGTPVSLSSVEKKVTIIYFWASTAEQMMFNKTSLIPIYEEFHPKGLEIYAVALDADKSSWAAAVRNQELPWVNVCDTRGAYSPYVNTYGVTTLPMIWIIKDGEIVPALEKVDEDTLRAWLRKNL